MKKYLLFVFTMLCTSSLFTACDDDEKTEPEVPVLLKGETTFSGEKLLLTYGGMVMPGKEITFATTDGKTGTLTMKGALDFSSLIASKADSPLAIGVSGVIPGEVSTVITDIVLTQEDDKYVFEGTDTNGRREITYSGVADETVLDLDLKVVFPDNELNGTWETGIFDRANMRWRAFHTVWEAGELIEWNSRKMTLNDVLQLALFYPLIGENSVGEIFILGALKDVTFRKDGNISATYSKVVDINNPQWTTSPLNIAQYTVEENTVRLFLNVDMILTNIRTKARIANLPAEVLEGILTEIVPMLSEGFPLKYKSNPEYLIVYADTELVLKLAKVLLPLLLDENMINIIMASIEKDPAMAAFRPIVENVLKSLPAVIASTNNVELGLYLSKE